MGAANNTPLTLASPLPFGAGPSSPNRVMKSAMSEALGTSDHNPDERLVRLYRRWAEGGAGLLVTGNVMIDRCALGEPGNVVLEDDRALDAFVAWAAAVHAANATTVLWMQINHPGKQSPSVVSKVPVAPSAVPLTGSIAKAFNPPRALEDAEIEGLVARFAASAALAERAGFHGVQIHAAHGYLVSQFLSPHHNRREDRWGGSAENRRRFLLEIYRAIRSRTGPGFSVAVKLNSADFQRGGFTEEESLQVVSELGEAGIDLIEISGGTYEKPAMTGSQRPSTVAREAYFLDFAAKARAATSAPLAVTGGFRSAAAMQEALSSGATDLIGLARPLALYPDLPQSLLNDPEFKVTLPAPSSGNKKLDAALMLDVTWYEHQLARMGAGDEPDPSAGVWGTVWGLVRTGGAAVFRKRRA